MEYNYKLEKAGLPVTKTYSFLYPLLELDEKLSSNFNSITKSKVMNAFIGDTDLDIGNEPHLFVMHGVSPSLSYVEWDNAISKLPSFVNSYSIQNGFIGIKIFTFPKKFLHELSMFKEGKYSQFSNLAKSIITKYFLAKREMRFVEHTLNKYLALKKFWEKELDCILPEDAELWSKPIEIDEMLTKSKKRILCA